MMLRSVVQRLLASPQNLAVAQQQEDVGCIRKDMARHSSLHQSGKPELGMGMHLVFVRRLLDDMHHKGMLWTSEDACQRVACMECMTLEVKAIIGSSGQVVPYIT